MQDVVRRRVITYDQRQEGQYNIRADLDNFMIVLIPSGVKEGYSLLEMLATSTSRSRTSNKRQHAQAAALKSFYEHQQLQQQQQLQHQPISPSALPDFIEGRTPYHVDISSANEELQLQPRLQRQQVDVLPPQLVPMPQLIRPYHLEAEPELIQALPPASGGVNNSGSSSSSSSSANPAAAAQYYRNSRSLLGNSFVDNNQLAGSDSLGSTSTSNARSISVPLYRSDAVQHSNVLYPPIDVPGYIVKEAESRNWHLDEEPTPILMPRADQLDAEVLSFELLGDALAESKTLLRDGLARCAPGQRRDSYGACRQIAGY
ncbi:GH13422 [Drosophila grimshawi]|uniref:GH13422 n=1 Tax=Drosophila grimshawi TaxID=7222 RepID=B4JPD8_DROGR|nr:GH13422 [Drosophila grimshawi]